MISQVVAVAIMLGLVTAKPPPAATAAVDSYGEFLLLSPGSDPGHPNTSLCEAEPRVLTA
jgi:hypothetical protein